MIGVGRFIEKRQDFENQIARSYQVEMAARVKVAQGVGGIAARQVVGHEARHREELRDQISDDTRNTAILVAAG